MYGCLIPLDQRSVVAANYSTALSEIRLNAPGCFACRAGNATLEKKKTNKQYLCEGTPRLLFKMSSTFQKPLLLKVIIGDAPLTKWNTFATGTSLCPFTWRYTSSLWTSEQLMPSVFATNGQLFVGLRTFMTLCIFCMIGHFDF